jgi:hypothetical protein
MRADGVNSQDSSDFIAKTLSSGNGVFVVVRTDQWKRQSETGRVQMFNSLYTISAGSYQEGYDKWVTQSRALPPRALKAGRRSAASATFRPGSNGNG